MTGRRHTHLWFQSLCWLALGLSHCCPTFGQDLSTEACNAPPKTEAKLAYSVSCVGRSECAAVDVLEIKPLDSKARQIERACLRFVTVGSTPNPKAVYKLQTYPLGSGSTSPLPLAYNLGPLVQQWLDNSDLGPILRSRRDARITLQAELTDTEGTQAKVLFKVDISSIWQGASSSLTIADVVCESCGFDSPVEVTIPALGVWTMVNKIDTRNLSLVISGYKLTGMAPMLTDPDTGKLHFHLRKIDTSPENIAAWRAIVARALSDDNQFRVSLADEKGIIASSAKDLNFDFPSKNARIIWTLGFAVAMIAAIALVGFLTKWRLLRDSYGIPESIIGPDERSFSLARCQMLWWTLIVAVSWFAIGISTKNWFSLDESALLLMGISAGTAAFAMGVIPEVITQKVDAYKAALNASTLASNDPIVAAAKTVVRDIPGVRSARLFRDLVSDFNDVPGLHRIQIILFSLAYGIVYAWQAFNTGMLPALSTTVLTLLGISSSAYVGFKFINR